MLNQSSHKENFNAKKVFSISDLKFWGIYHESNDFNAQLVLLQEIFCKNNINSLPGLTLFFFSV